MERILQYTRDGDVVGLKQAILAGGKTIGQKHLELALYTAAWCVRDDLIMNDAVCKSHHVCFKKAKVTVKIFFTGQPGELDKVF